MSDETNKPEAGQNPAPRPSGIQTGILSSRIAPPTDAPIPGPGPRPAAAGQPVPPVEPPSPPAPPRPVAPPDPSRWSVRGALLSGLITIAVLLGGFAVWALQSRIAGAVVASGQVEVEQQRQVVQHPDGGVVEEILVKDGQTVQAGQALIRLDGNLLRTEHAIVEGQYFEILARRGRLEAERADSDSMAFPPELVGAAQGNADLQALMEGQRSLFETRRDTLRQSIEQLEKQSEQVRQQVEGIDAQVAARDHDAVRLLQDLVEVVDALLVLDLGDDLDILAVLAQHLADRLDVRASTDEGREDHVDAVFDAEAQVALVLFGERGKVDVGLGQVDALARGDLAIVHAFAAEGLRVDDVEHGEGENAVVDEDDAAFFDHFGYVLVVDVPRDVSFVVYKCAVVKGAVASRWIEDSHVFLSAGCGVLLVRGDVDLFAGADGNVFIVDGVASSDLWPFLEITCVRDVERAWIVA